MKHTFIFFFLFATLPCRAQWTSAGFPSERPVLAFGVHDTSFFLSYTATDPVDSLIYRYIPGANWMPYGAGIDRTQGIITTFASLGKYFFVAQHNGVGQIIFSTDNGQHWNGKCQAAGPFGTNGRHLFGEIYYNPPNLLRSLDSGKTFDSVWQLTTTSIGGTGAFVFATNNGFWRSLDSGSHWGKVTAPLSNITSTAIVGSAFYAANGTPGHGGGQLMRSTDSGATWGLVTTSFSVSSLAADSTHLFAGGTAGVYLLGADGATWTYESGTGNLNGKGIVALGVFDSLLFADFTNVTYPYDLYSRSIPEMTAKSAVAVVPAPRDTLAIHPNPATGFVTIFAGGTSIERVNVLNVLGVDVLDVQNPHESEITLDLSKVPSGTYFLQIVTANGTVMRKIVKE